MDNNMNVQNNMAPQYVPQPPKEKKPKKKGGKNLLVPILAGSIALVAIIVTVIVLIVTAPTTIDISKYVTYSFEGYDHYGQADVVIDFEGIAKEHQEELELKTKQDVSTALITMNECITVKVESYTNLQNKQEFVVKFDIDNKLMKERYNCVLKCKEIKTVVGGLTELIAINPFDYIELTYNGNVEYTADVSLSYVGTYADVAEDAVDWYTDSWSDVYNGQEITVELDEDAEWFAEQGYYVTEFEKTYTISGLDTNFGIKISDIDQTSLDNHISEIKTMLMSDHDTITDVVYVGATLVERTDKTNAWYDANTLTLVYEVKVTDETGDWSYYFTSDFTAITKAYNGSVNLTGLDYEYPTAYMGWFGVNGTGFAKNEVVYAGYETLEEIYDGTYESSRYTMVDVTIK